MSGSITTRKRARRGDEHLERPLPALPLDRAARPEERRRPDAHQPGAERRRRAAPPARAPASNMKKAIVAKITGCSTEISTKKSEFVRFFRWKSQPIARTASCQRRARASSCGLQRVARRRASCSTTSHGADEPVASGSVDDADQRLGAEQARTRRSGGTPSASCRTASIPCVNGITSETACIQPGRSSIGTFAPREDEQQPEDDVREHRGLADDEAEPGVDEPEPGAREGAHGGDERDRRPGARGHLHPDDRPADDERERATKKPLATTGSARPRKSGSRLAGVIRM